MSYWGIGTGGGGGGYRVQGLLAVINVFDKKKDVQSKT